MRSAPVRSPVQGSQPDKNAAGEDVHFLENVNLILWWSQGLPCEPSLAAAKVGEGFQFEREGYFCLDSKDSQPDALVFNRTVTLRDSWGGK